MKLRKGKAKRRRGARASEGKPAAFVAAPTVPGEAAGGMVRITQPLTTRTVANSISAERQVYSSVREFIDQRSGRASRREQELEEMQLELGKKQLELLNLELQKAKGQPKQIQALTERERKIWSIIQQGSKGPQYCRELDHAAIKPRRSGSWKDKDGPAPGTYLAAYKAGAPWVHRIEDEKSKIRRKAELAKLAGE